MQIICKLYQLELETNLLSPDIEIKWQNGLYATLGRTHHGLQTNYKNDTDIMNKCSEIAQKMFELYDLIQKEEKRKEEK